MITLDQAEDAVQKYFDRQFQKQSTIKNSAAVIEVVENVFNASQGVYSIKCRVRCLLEATDKGYSIAVDATGQIRAVRLDDK